MKKMQGHFMLKIGVGLILVGILLVGGMVGYTQRKNRSDARQILEMASKTAFVAQTLNGGTGGMACTGAICQSSDGLQTGIVWTTTANVAKFVASVDKGAGAVTVILSGNILEGVIPAGVVPASVQDALVAIAKTDDAVTYRKPFTLTLKTEKLKGKGH